MRIEQTGWFRHRRVSTWNGGKGKKIDTIHGLSTLQILNGITNIANVVKDTAAVLSVVAVIGAVSSQIGTAANIFSSVSSIIGVAERYVWKHTPVVPMAPPIEETEIQMTPIESQSVAMVTNANASSTTPQTSQAIFNLSP